MIMKFLKRPTFALLILALFAIHANEALACSYFDDEGMLAERDACQEDASKEWSCDLNRCVTTQESKQVRDDYLVCATMENDAERKACHDEYAKHYTGDLSTKEPPHMMAAGINAAFAGLMGIAALSKNPNGGKCYSKWIVLGTGAMALVSELYFRFVANKEIKDLREEYDKEVPGEPYYAQVRALEYLKQEQEALSKMAGNRKKAYMLQMAGYTVGAVAAIFEAWKGTCGGKGKSDASQDAGTSSADAGTSGTDAASTGTDAASGTTSVSGGTKGLGAMMGSPAGVAIVAGIGAALSGYMWKVSADQEKQSEENAERVQEMIDQFMASMAGFCPEGRDNMQNARCYCYNPDGSKNSNRTRSETCQALWAEDDQNFYVAGKDYGALKKVTSTGCMTVNGKYDQECACKKLKNNQGENACMKVPATGASIKGIDTALSTAAIGKDVNGINQGEFSAADLNAANLEKLAARANLAKKKILDAANKDLKSKKKGQIPELNNKFVESVLRATPKSYRDQMLANYAPLDLTKSRPSDSNFEKALQQALDSGNLKDATIQGGKGIHSGSKKALGGFNLGDGGSSGSKVEKFMDKEYKMKDSDIVNRDDVPIWTIISNRYTISGLKRLFNNDISELEEAANDTSKPAGAP